MMNGFFESFFFEENMAGMYDCWMAHDLFKTDRRLGISQMVLDPTIGGKMEGTYNYMWATMVDAPDTWAKCLQAPMIDSYQIKFLAAKTIVNKDRLFNF
jgi:hypothetical protein